MTRRVPRRHVLVTVTKVNATASGKRTIGTTNVPGCLVKVDDVAGHLGMNPVEEITRNCRWLNSDVAP